MMPIFSEKCSKQPIIENRHIFQGFIQVNWEKGFSQKKKKAAATTTIANPIVNKITTL
jgi:hypothetical protein